MGKILGHFNRSKLPDRGFLKNLLERTFSVDRTPSEELASLLIANAKYCGILQDISGSQYIRIDAPVITDASLSQGEDDSTEEGSVVDLNAVRERQDTLRAPLDVPKEPGKIFVAHGKKLKPVDGLKKILDQFKIPYKVAVDEPAWRAPNLAQGGAAHGRVQRGDFRLHQGRAVPA
jgi:hypothetical protein